MVLSCGHSFGGLMLKKVLEMVYSETSYSVFCYCKSATSRIKFSAMLLDTMEINSYPESEFV